MVGEYRPSTKLWLGRVETWKCLAQAHSHRKAHYQNGYMPKRPTSKTDYFLTFTGQI